MKPDGGGERYNEGKPKWSLLAWDAIGEVVRVYTFGATKYAPRNWERGMLYSDVADSMHRHFVSWWHGEKNDEESGLPHLAHMVWNGITLLSYEIRDMGSVLVKHKKTGEMVPADDRPFKGEKSNAQEGSRKEEATGEEAGTRQEERRHSGRMRARPRRSG